MEFVLVTLGTAVAAVAALRVARRREESVIERARKGEKPREGDPALVPVRTDDQY